MAIVKRKKYPFWIGLYRIIKYNFIVLMRKQDSPESIAHGLAQGIFVGFFPIVPFQAISAIIVNSIFKTNRFAGFIGTNIFTNWLNLIPTFYGLHLLGKLFISVDVNYEKFTDSFTNLDVTKLAEFGYDLWLSMMIGGAITAVATYIPIYYYTKRLVIKFRNRKKRK